MTGRRRAGERGVGEKVPAVTLNVPAYLTAELGRIVGVLGHTLGPRDREYADGRLRDLRNLGRLERSERMSENAGKQAFSVILSERS